MLGIRILRLFKKLFGISTKPKKNPTPATADNNEKDELKKAEIAEQYEGMTQHEMLKAAFEQIGDPILLDMIDPDPGTAVYNYFYSSGFLHCFLGFLLMIMYGFPVETMCRDLDGVCGILSFFAGVLMIPKSCNSSENCTCYKILTGTCAFACISTVFVQIICFAATYADQDGNDFLYYAISGLLVLVTLSHALSTTKNRIVEQNVQNETESPEKTEKSEKLSAVVVEDSKDEKCDMKK